MRETIRLAWPFAVAEMVVRLVHDATWQLISAEYQLAAGVVSLLASVAVMFALGWRLRSSNLSSPYKRAAWCASAIWLLSAIVLPAAVDLALGWASSVAALGGHLITFIVLLPPILAASSVGVFLRGRIASE